MTLLPELKNLFERGPFITPLNNFDPQNTNANLPVETRSLFQTIIGSDLNRDGQVTEQEATQKLETLNNQVKMLNIMKLFFPYAEQYFNAYIEQCQQQINTLNLIFENSDAFTAAGKADVIDNADLYAIIDAAQTDGDIYSFTAEDLAALKGEDLQNLATQPDIQPQWDTWDV